MASPRKQVIADIAEDIRCDQAMLQEYRKRADPAAFAAKAHEIDLQIASLKARKLELEQQHTEAPKQVTVYERRIQAKREKLALENNRKQVTQLDKLKDRLAALIASDPSAAAAVRQMIESGQL